MAKASPRNYRRKPRYVQRKDRHTTSLLTDHLVITPKYRGKVLKGEVAIECEKEIRWVCKQLDIDIIQMAVAEDHVHLFIQYPPRLAPSKIVEKIKSNSSRKLRETYPHLVGWSRKALWAPGCFHGSVGQGFDVVENYIAAQR
jgi:putative transposase